MEQKSKIFIDGMSMKEKKVENMPWLKASIGIKLDKFVEFANKHVDERGWLNMNLLESKAGALYIELDTWKRTPLEKPEALKEVDPSKIPF